MPFESRCNQGKLWSVLSAGISCGMVREAARASASIAAYNTCILVAILMRLSMYRMWHGVLTTEGTSVFSSSCGFRALCVSSLLMFKCCS